MDGEQARSPTSLRLPAIAVAMVAAAFVLLAAWLASVTARVVGMGTVTLVSIGVVTAAVTVAAPLVLLVEWSRARKRAGKSMPRRLAWWLLAIANTLVAASVVLWAPLGSVTGGLGLIEHALRSSPQGPTAPTTIPPAPTAPPKTAASPTVTPLATTTAAPTADAPGKANVKLVVDGVESTLAHAMVQGSAGGFRLMLSDRPMRCGAAFGSDREIYGLIMPFFPGTGARYFAGESVRVRAQVRGPFNNYAQGDNLYPAALLSVVSFHAEPGGHFKGSIDIDGRTSADSTVPKHSSVRATGSIDAVLCEVSASDLERVRSDHAEPPVDLSGPFAGRVAGVPFRSASVVAWVVPPVAPFLGGVASVAFFEAPGVTCEAAMTTYPLVAASIDTVDPRDPAGTPIVVNLVRVKDERTHAASNGHGWLRFQSKDLVPGTTVVGTAHGWSNDTRDGGTTNAGGRFEAKVCNSLADMNRDR